MPPNQAVSLKAQQRINEKLGLAHRSDYVDFALKLGLMKQQ